MHSQYANRLGEHCSLIIIDTLQLDLIVKYNIQNSHISQVDLQNMIEESLYEMLALKDHDPFFKRDTDR